MTESKMNSENNGIVTIVRKMYASDPWQNSGRPCMTVTGSVLISMHPWIGGVVLVLFVACLAWHGILACFVSVAATQPNLSSSSSPPPFLPSS
jgi:hypothetical protein